MTLLNISKLQFAAEPAAINGFYFHTLKFMIRQLISTVFEEYH